MVGAGRQGESKREMGIIPDGRIVYDSITGIGDLKIGGIGGLII